MIQPRTVLITGSHTRGTYQFTKDVLDAQYEKEKWDRLVTGGADFVDTIAAQWAFTNRRSFAVEYAKWENGKMAGPIRNERMYDLYKPYLVLAFNGDVGTHRMMAYARSHGTEVREFHE